MTPEHVLRKLHEIASQRLPQIEALPSNAADSDRWHYLLQIAQAYAAMTLAYHETMPLVVEALTTVAADHEIQRAEVAGIKVITQDLEQLRRDVATLIRLSTGRATPP